MSSFNCAEEIPVILPDLTENSHVNKLTIKNNNGYSSGRTGQGERATSRQGVGTELMAGHGTKSNFPHKNFFSQHSLRQGLVAAALSPAWAQGDTAPPAPCAPPPPPGGFDTCFSLHRQTTAKTTKRSFAHTPSFPHILLH